MLLHEDRAPVRWLTVRRQRRCLCRRSRQPFREGAHRPGFYRDAAEVADQIAKSSLEEAGRLLAEPLKALERAKIAVKSKVLLGEPANESAAHVEDSGADCVVMGTRGLGAVGGLVLGSVASKVVHLVKVPVTLVK
jgi:nucleotide-binding universal stress UspA family protein